MLNEKPNEKPLQNKAKEFRVERAAEASETENKEFHILGISNQSQCTHRQALDNVTLE